MRAIAIAASLRNTAVAIADEDNRSATYYEI
jgi:hypothetical protein